MQTKKDIFAHHLRAYLDAPKQKKSAILDHVSGTAGIPRNAAVKRFRRLQLHDSAIQEKRGRPIVYGKDSTTALRSIWEQFGMLCAELLHPQMGAYIDNLVAHRHWKYSDEATAQLRTMGERTMKRRIAEFPKVKRQRKTAECMLPDSHLKKLIPTQHGSWRNMPPGNGQLDTVYHSGPVLGGDAVYTLNWVSPVLTWSARRAQWNRSKEATLHGLDTIRKRLPFCMTGAHPDTGGEFINNFLHAYCLENDIAYTRSRPGHCNDNAHVEERNKNVVRHYLGEWRFDRIEVVDAMNEFYESLDLYLNHCVAVRRTIRKKFDKKTKKSRRIYEAATPYDRVLAHPDIPEDVKDALRAEHATIDMLQLKKKVDKLLIQVFKIQRMRADK